LGTEVVTGKPGIASESHDEVSTHSKRKQWLKAVTNPFDNLSRMTALSDDSSGYSGVPSHLGGDQGEDDALPMPPPSRPPSPPPPMTIDPNSPPHLGTEYHYPALNA
jgi:hypothetical protein